MTEREFWDALMRLLRALRDAYNQSLQGEDELPGRIEEAAIPALLVALGSADESLRAGAAWVLGRTRQLILASKAGQVAPTFIEALKHPDAGVKAPLPDQHNKDHYYLEDLGSRNGTLINGEKLEPGRRYRLRDGDSVLIGRVALTFKAERRGMRDEA